MLKTTKKSLTFLLAFILLSVTVFSNSFIQINAGENQVTLYFVDATSEKWIGNDNAVMECVDNTHYHKKYDMTKQSDHIWKVIVPSSAYNITFNRYNPEKSQQWNSWSAGGRDGNVTYLAQGHSHGQWTSQSYGTDYFETGNVIYLDFSDFKQWSQDNALQYVNFTNASKAENNNQDIDIFSASKTLYAPVILDEKISDTLYSYTIKETDVKSEYLRFWRGNDKTLWNCSIALSHADYVSGKNCIKITGWNQGDLTYYETAPDILIDTSSLTYDETLEAWFCDEKSDTLKGTLTSTENISRMEYHVKDLSDNLLLSGIVELSEAWEINNFGLSYGYNNVTVKAIMKSGKEYSTTITIWNTASENLDNLTIDISDTDEDGLNNYLELLHKTNSENADTDSDKLLDSHEIYVFDTNPLLSDTDGNGVIDSEEDFDNDGLSNIYEITLGTSPQYPDTDNDGLTDEEEVNQYKTNPLKEDTDDDTLLDGSEIKLGFDPNNKDTDNDSILDCDEVTQQEYIQETSEDIITNISVTMECTGERRPLSLKCT